tara:strand:+ start:3023 stop:3871 length:849 start_codon:yes stop_codon:yes gene_type:complete
MIEIPLNDLPLFDKRIPNLIQDTKMDLLPRENKDIEREFNKESWGKLLKSVKELKPSVISEIDDLYANPKDNIVISIKNKLFHTTQREAYAKLIGIFSEHLLGIKGEYIHFVEMGCGYGSKIFNLMELPQFKTKTFSATEFTANGQLLTSTISKLLGKEINVGYVDFNAKIADKQSVPDNSVIFTSYSLHYIEELDIEFWNFIDGFNPKAIVAFEPCFELYGRETVLGIMQQKYHHENRYTKNITSSLQEFCNLKNQKLKIIPNVFGLNPLLPISVLIYNPE